MAEHEAPEHNKGLGESSSEYANLETSATSEKVADVYSELANKYEDNPELLALIQRMAESSSDETLDLGNDEVDSKIVKADIGDSLRFIDEYMKNPKRGGSPTLIDITLGNLQDEVAAEHIMRLLGSNGRQYGEVETDELQPDRFETTTYLTDIPGYVLRRWRHHPTAPTLQGLGAGDKEKFFVERMD